MGRTRQNYVVARELQLLVVAEGSGTQTVEERSICLYWWTCTWSPHIETPANTHRQLPQPLPIIPSGPRKDARAKAGSSRQAGKTIAKVNKRVNDIVRESTRNLPAFVKKENIKYNNTSKI